MHLISLCVFNFYISLMAFNSEVLWKCYEVRLSSGLLCKCNWGHETDMLNCHQICVTRWMSESGFSQAVPAVRNAKCFSSWK